jgi:hypothetical protein
MKKIALFRPYVILRHPFVTKMSLIKICIMENEENKFHHLGYKIMLKHSISALSHISGHKTHNFVSYLPKRPFLKFRHLGYKIMLKHSRSALSRTYEHKTHNFVI